MNKDRNDRHRRIKRALQIGGIAITAAGVILSAVGLGSFFFSMSGGGFPSLFFCCFIGFPALAVGTAMLRFAYKREIDTYSKNESVSVFNEAARESQPGVRAIAEAARDGLKESTAGGIGCPACGEKNEADAKFCKNCGAALQKTCPACGTQNDPDAKFCDNCGHPFGG